MKISKAQAKRELAVGRKLRLIYSLIGPTSDTKGYRTVKLVRSADVIMTNHDKENRDSTLTMQCTSVDLTGKVLTFFEVDRIAAQYRLDCERPNLEGGSIHGDI